MPIFFSSAPAARRDTRAHQKRREFLAADLGEDRVQIRAAAVGDPHLLAVQDVVLPSGLKIGASARGQRIGAGLRLAQAIRGHHFALASFGR
jgi:hypothetical protein